MYMEHTHEQSKTFIHTKKMLKKKKKLVYTEINILKQEAHGNHYRASCKYVS